MRTRGLWRLLGALAAPGALLCAVAAGCEPQDIYLFDEVAEPPEPDAGGDEPEPEPEPDAEAPAFEQPPCGSRACDDCVADGDCSLAAGTLFCHPATGSCEVPCDPDAPAEDRQCPASQQCNPDFGLCVDCVVSDHCSGGPLQACDAERGVCVECVGPDTCTTPERPYCDVTDQLCVGCRGDDDCAAAGQVCLLGEQRCVQCRVDADCIGFEDDNRCVTDDNVCGECVDDSDCIAIDPTRPFCRQTDHECEDEDE
jgi:hypothetical protein